jgi:hypothetical protein
MNGPAALISAGIGAIFFTAASMFYYQPAFIKSDALDQLLTTNHSRARAAVTRLLHEPASAQFDVMRSVQVEGAKYVCGSVNAKDKAGAYAGNKAFVYTVANDFARIDDDGQIAQRHVSFKLCPLSEEEEKIAKRKLALPPGAIDMAKKLQKAMPTADESALTTLSSQLSAGELPSSGSSERSLSQTIDAPASGSALSGVSGAQTSATFKAYLDAEDTWRADRPPSAWPEFPASHPLSKPATQRTPAEALALAKDAETRWIKFKSGETRKRPSSDLIQEALRALLAIDEKDETFPQAWAAFVRLRRIEREARSKPPTTSG